MFTWPATASKFAAEAIDWANEMSSHALRCGHLGSDVDLRCDGPAHRVTLRPRQHRASHCGAGHEVNVAETIVAGLTQLGVTTVWGVVGDALNPVTDAIRRDGRISWMGVRHEEAGAFAASAQAQVSGTLGVCMGTVGPGSVHLLNGLYDAAKSQAPVLAICGQVPLAEIGSRYFQEVDNDLLFTDVAGFRATISSPAQMPRILEQAVNSAYGSSSVSVLTMPGDVGEMEVPGGDRQLHFVTRRPRPAPDEAALDEAVELIDRASTVTILAGRGAIEARQALLGLAERLSAPMVLTLKAKEGLEHDDPYEVGQSGLIGNPRPRWPSTVQTCC